MLAVAAASELLRQTSVQIPMANNHTVSHNLTAWVVNRKIRALIQALELVELVQLVNVGSNKLVQIWAANRRVAINLASVIEAIAMVLEELAHIVASLDSPDRRTTPMVQDTKTDTE